MISPADGTVVYVKDIQPEERVITIKKEISACIEEIAPEIFPGQKILIGIFMSPFNVHVNRAPITGRVEFTRHYPAVKSNRHMGPMHLRSVLRWPPYYRNSLHIIQNERTITAFGGLFKGRPILCCVVQIAGRSVRGIDSYVKEGDLVEKGAVFGMIRIGSQVDLVVPAMEGMRIRVRPGDKVRAGESILID